MSNFVDLGSKRIGLNEVGAVSVSTVLLPFHYDGWKYETMVFSDVEIEDNCERYQTREEAELGHARWVKKIFGEVPQ